MEDERKVSPALFLSYAAILKINNYESSSPVLISHWYISSNLSGVIYWLFDFQKNEIDQSKEDFPDLTMKFKKRKSDGRIRKYRIECLIESLIRSNSNDKRESVISYR